MLHGCSHDGGHDFMENVPTGKRVIIMRHCVRSTSKDTKPYTNSAGDAIKASDLTKIPFPDWGVEEKFCTEEGKRIIEGVGAYIKKTFGPDESNLKMVADHSAQRDITTSLHLAKGMGVDAKVIQLNQAVFDDTDGGACDEAAAGGDAQWDTEYHVPNFGATDMPMGIGKPTADNENFAANWNNMLARLEAIIGTGPNYKITEALKMDQSNLPTPQDIIKACGILKFYAQQFLYAYASGIEWGITLEPSKIFEWAAWIYYARHVKYPVEELVTKGLTITHTMLTDLNNDGMSTTIYVGHDSDIDEVSEILGGLKWKLPDYGVHGTPPGSGFVFTRDPGSSDVHIHYMYTKFDGNPSAEDPSNSVVVSPGQTFKWAELNNMYNEKPKQYPRAKACKDALDAALAKDDGVFDPTR
jgi:hypothetical protein